jgi:hypothetical protein
MASAGRMIHHLDPFINVETEQWKLGSSVKMVPVGRQFNKIFKS